MDVRTGEVYPSKQAAIDAGVPARYVQEVTGPQAREYSHKSKVQRKKRNRAVRKARRAGRS